jgi:predicted histone-like DNA-binding protein
MKRLATLISMQSTVSKADCLAVLTSLEENIILELNDGKIVELGEIGTLQIGVNSTGHNTEEEVSSNSVIKARTLFRPGVELRKMLNNVSST